MKNLNVDTCPVDPQGSTRTLSYAMNSNLDKASLAVFQAPASCILLIDEEDNSSRALDDGYFVAPSSDQATGGPVFPADYPTTRHTDGANFAYADSHVKRSLASQLSWTAFNPAFPINPFTECVLNF